jgi:hypothetical protein
VLKLSLECQALVFPQFPLCDQRPLRKAEHTRGRRKSTQKRQEALFCDQIIPLPAPKRRVVAAARTGETPPKALFSDFVFGIGESGEMAVTGRTISASSSDFGAGQYTFIFSRQHGPI